MPHLLNYRGDPGVEQLLEMRRQYARQPDKGTDDIRDTIVEIDRRLLAKLQSHPSSDELKLLREHFVEQLRALKIKIEGGYKDLHALEEWGLDLIRAVTGSRPLTWRHAIQE